jgi:hypothetical protein
VSPYKQFRVARKYGYRSGLELKISDYLKELKVKFLYEGIKIEWEDLAYRTYTPDFVLHNGIIIETKGRFTAADRRKHLAIKKQHPKLDIRFVFTNSKSKLRKGAKSSYAGNWTGEVDISIIAFPDNTLDDVDYDQVMHFAKMMCASVPVMEQAKEIREIIHDYVMNVIDNETEFTVDLEEEAGVEKSYDGNVVHLNFNTKTGGSA